MNIAELRKQFKEVFGHEAPESLTEEQLKSILLSASDEKEVKMAEFEVKSINKEEMTVDVIISSENRDRYGDIVLQDGIDYTNFEGNPVIPFAHNYWEPPVAKAVKWWKTTGKKGKVTKMRLKFMDFDEFSTKIFKMIEGGFLSAVSVGFIPKKWRDEKDESGVWTRFYTQIELLEVSVVPVPANPDALSLAMKKGLIDEEDTKSFHGKMQIAEKGFTSRGAVKKGVQTGVQLSPEMKSVVERIAEMKEKGVDEARMWKLFFQYHDGIKEYRSFFGKIQKLLGVEGEEEESATVAKTAEVLLDMISETSSQEDDPVPADPLKTHSANPVAKKSSKARTAKKMTGKNLEQLVERSLA